MSGLVRTPVESQCAQHRLIGVLDVPLGMEILWPLSLPCARCGAPAEAAPSDTAWMAAAVTARAEQALHTFERRLSVTRAELEAWMVMVRSSWGAIALAAQLEIVLVDPPNK